MIGTDRAERLQLEWADVTSRYWNPETTFGEAKRLLHSAVRYEESPETISEFLMRVGEERNPRESDEALRREARKLLARFLKKRVKNADAGNGKLHIAITHFFADCEVHSWLPERELEYVRSFVRHEYHHWYTEWATRGRYHPILPSYYKVITRALVNVCAYEYLRERYLIGAIPHLYKQLVGWLRVGHNGGRVWGFMEHPDLLTRFEAREFSCGPSCMVEMLEKQGDISSERQFFQTLTSVNGLCGAVFVHYDWLYHKTHRECAMTLLALIAISSMLHGEE